MYREKSESQRMIEAFMKKAGQNVPDKPTMPDPETRILRAKLIFEEAVRELIGEGLRVVIRYYDEKTNTYFLINQGHTPGLSFLAIDGGVDMVKIADGAADTQVVTKGTLSACGIADEVIQKAVDESNLAKFTKPRCPDCDQEMNFVSMSEGWVCSVGHFRRKPLNAGGYRSDGTDGNPKGKWVKSVDWKAPDIKGILEGQSKPEVIAQKVHVVYLETHDEFNHASLGHWVQETKPEAGPGDLIRFYLAGILVLQGTITTIGVGEDSNWCIFYDFIHCLFIR
jgi:predicted HAD superfamily Cof-like phosphohydrolase